MNSPKYTKLLTPEEYERLTLDEKAEYITAMATVLKSRLPAVDPPPDATNGAQDDPLPRAGTNQGQGDPPPGDASSQGQDDPPRGNATGEAQDDPPAGTATNQAQEDPPPSNDKPRES